MLLVLVVVILAINIVMWAKLDVIHTHLRGGDQRKIDDLTARLRASNARLKAAINSATKGEQ